MAKFISWVTSLIRKKPTVVFDSSPKKVWKICLSPGHGGGDSGAVSATGQTEAAVVRRIALSMNKYFSENLVFSVVLSGMGERIKDYTSRVRESDARGDDYYLPIHINSSLSPKSNGFLIFVDPADYERDKTLKDLCASILNQLIRNFPIGFADYDENKDGFSAGIGRKIYEMSKPLASSIYLELGFLSNADWNAALCNDDTIDKLAKSVVDGFTDYLKV